MRARDVSRPLGAQRGCGRYACVHVCTCACVHAVLMCACVHVCLTHLARASLMMACKYVSKQVSQ